VTIAGIILAGGRSSRMGGGDKTLLPLGGHTIIEEAISRLKPQVDQLALNANGDPTRFAHLALPTLRDAFGTFDGPLAGILTGLIWAEALGVEKLITAAGDTPFLPHDLVARLSEAASENAIILAASYGQRHPTFALWPVSLRSHLAEFLSVQDSRRVNDFIARHPHAMVDFPTEPFDPFFNINTSNDLEQAQRLADLNL
jgi:molybdopterin-guanine dinucleotide biosynthesis protein A